jgi:hypothetical protein
VIDRDAPAVYLNDHLEGSIAALDMMERICCVHEATALGVFMSGLQCAVESDQLVLRALLESVNASESSKARTIAGAWSFTE